MSFEHFIGNRGNAVSYGSGIHPSTNPHGYGIPMNLGKGGGFGPYHPYGPNHPYGRGPHRWYPHQLYSSSVSYPYTVYPCMCRPYESNVDCYQRKIYYDCPTL
jgi:hypothetical protein